MAEMAEVILNDIWSVSKTHRDEALNLITKILDNIKNNPNEEKFRTINLTKIQSKFHSCPSAVQLLYLVGFESENNNFIKLNKLDIDKFDIINNLLRSRINEENHKLELERNKVIADTKRKSEEYKKEKNKERDMVKKQLAIDNIERRQEQLDKPKIASIATKMMPRKDPFQSGGEIHHIETAQDFESLISSATQHKKNVIVDFFATWCGPCKMIAPKYEELAKKYPSIIFAKVDVDKNSEIASKYQIKSMPTFIIISNGNEIVSERIKGANLPSIEQLVEKYK